MPAAEFVGKVALADIGIPEACVAEEEIPLQLEGFPQRPKFLLELGNPYLGTGRIGKGVKLFTGAIWQPTLIAFGEKPIQTRTVA